MKTSLVTMLFLPAVALAFAPKSQPRAGVTTWPLKGGASTYEEDLELTRQVIAKFMDGQGDDKPAVPVKEEPAKKEEE
jgi:hypothetical protein